MPTTPLTPDAAATVPPPPQSPQDRVAAILDRPPDQRVREYKYRFAQSVVFGLPVIALELFGPSLGGREAARWVFFLQVLLAGWVIYVGAAGMLFEGVLLLRNRVTADLIVATTAVTTYLLSATSLAPGLFPWAVSAVAIWTAFKWWLGVNFPPTRASH